MLKKIYFGDKPLFLSDGNTNDIKPYLDDKGTIVIENPEDKELDDIIRRMSDTSTTAGVIFKDVPEAIQDITKKFTLIVASGGMVYTKDNKILLIFRRGKWDLPKGKLDDGEDLIECALREVNEETGLSNLGFEQHLCTSYHTYFEGDKHILKESHWHLLKGNENEVLKPQTDEDIEKCEWVAIDQLASFLKNAPASIIDVIKEGINILNGTKKN